jgi:DNA-binding beta-propeller fold protein YncE
MRRLVIIPALLALLAAITFTEHADAIGIVATWPVGHQPFSVAVDPTDGRLYIANSGTVTPNNTGTVSVVSPAVAGAGTLSTSGTSDIVAIDPVRRRLYSANVNGTLDVFDLSNGARVATLPVGSGLGVAVDATTSRVYVAAGTRDFVMVDGITNAVVASRAVPPNQLWFGVWLDAGLHRVYVSNVDQSRPSLWVLDDRDLSVISEVLFPKPIRWAVAVDASSHVVYVAGSDPSGLGHSSFYTVEPTTLSVTDRTPLTGFPGGLALAPARHRIYLTDLSGNRVIALDDTTYAVTETIALPWGPSLPVMHPDGRLYVPAYQGSGADVLAALDIGAVPPVVDSVTLDPSQPRTNDTLQATVVAHDSQGRLLGPANLTYEWLRNGVVVAGPPGPTSQFLDLRTSGAGDRGDTISVRVTAIDGGQTSTPKTAFVVVQDSAPTAGVMLANGTPTTNATLTAASIALDPDNDPLSYTFTWKVNGVVRKMTSGPSSSDAFDLGMAGNGDRGDQVSVELIASDGTLQSQTALASATVANSPPTAAVSLNTTTPTTLDTLTATPGGQDPDHDALTYTFTWKVNGTVRAVTTGSNATTFDLSSAGNGDHGDTVLVEVVASDGSLQSGSATASVTVANSAPNVAVVLSSAAPGSRDMLTATANGQDADRDPLTYGFTWKVNGVVRRTSTGSSAADSLDLGVAGNGDSGDTVTVEVVASDGSLQSDVARATATVAVNSPPAVSVALSPASPASNAVVTATAAASDADQDPLSYSFTWKVTGVIRKTSSGPNPSDTFDLSVAGNGNHGDVVTVEVAVSDLLSSSTASATAVVANTPPTATVYLSSSTPATNDVLYAGVVAEDVDGDALSLSYIWRVNGAVKRTVTTTARVDRFDLSVKGNGDKRDVVTVTVTVSDGTASSAPTAASATVR